MSEPVHEAALSDAELATVLACCGRDALLVGGQALALWAKRFEVAPPVALQDGVTTDADFIGTAAIATRLQAALGPAWSIRIATLDDVGVQVAKVYTLGNYGAKQIDFLSGIVGLETSALHRRAAGVAASGGTFVRVIHPLDVLESRLRNLALLASKRTQAGIAQATLAIDVVNRFILETLLAEPGGRTAFSAVRRVIALATDSRIAPVAFEYGLVILAGVPAARISSAAFHSESWPRALDAVERLREKHRALAQRREALRRRKGPESA